MPGHQAALSTVFMRQHLSQKAEELDVCKLPMISSQASCMLSACQGHCAQLPRTLLTDSACYTGHPAGPAGHNLGL